jgi:hypothetical protein
VKVELREIPVFKGAPGAGLGRPADTAAVSGCIDSIR